MEILPSVDESPIPILCQEQLLLALRLFKPDPFWVMAWDRRRDFQAPTLSRPYALRGPEVTAFCKFAKRLLDFHFDRNRYRVLRNHPVWVYVGQVVADEKLSDHPALLPPDDPEAEKFLSRTTHVMVATDLFRLRS